MAENKTKPTNAAVDAFLDAVEDPKRRADAKAVCAMMARISGLPPRMWGSSIVGFGSYHYKYESGREGDAGRIGFSPRKAQLVIYIVDGFSRHGALMAKLGKYATGKSCLYVKKLSDLDQRVLEQLFAASLDYMNKTYLA